MNTILTINITDANQPTIALPPSADIPAPLPPNLPLPNWLLAILVLSTITTRLYQISRVILYIIRVWKKPPAEKTQ